MRGTKVDWGRKNVGKSDEHDRVCTRTEEEIQGQEASWASKADWEMSRAIGSAGAIEMASRVLRILVFLIQIFLS